MTAHALFDRNYNPNWPLAGDELAARRTDPVSSHEAAKNHFGAKGLEKDILAVFARPEYRDRWLTCDRRRAALQAEGGHMTTIEPGRYPIYCSLEWWNEVNDFVRRREVAAALDLPAEAVEIGFDSDEEVDLASVWLVADGHERAIGHVTFETDGTIVVEILDDDPLATAEDRAARLAVSQALDGLDGDKLREEP